MPAFNGYAQHNSSLIRNNVFGTGNNANAYTAAPLWDQFVTMAPIVRVDRWSLRFAAAGRYLAMVHMNMSFRKTAAATPEPEVSLIRKRNNVLSVALGPELATPMASAGLFSQTFDLNGLVDLNANDEIFFGAARASNALQSITTITAGRGCYGSVVKVG